MQYYGPVFLAISLALSLYYNQLRDITWMLTSLTCKLRWLSILTQHFSPVHRAPYIKLGEKEVKWNNNSALHFTQPTSPVSYPASSAPLFWLSRQEDKSRTQFWDKKYSSGINAPKKLISSSQNLELHNAINPTK